jgi:hypothetical protein
VVDFAGRLYAAHEVRRQQQPLFERFEEQLALERGTATWLLFCPSLDRLLATPANLPDGLPKIGQERHE